MFAPNLRLDELLQSHLRAFLQGADEGVIGALQAGVEWLELPAGGVLMREGEPGDAMYVLASGRLRVSITGADGRSRTMREITRGQVVGEMSLIADAPRSATLVAVRDSVLARLSRPSFDALVRQHPAVTMALTRQIIGRLQSQGQGVRPDRPVAIAFLPLGGRVDAATVRALVDGVAAELARHGRVARVDAAAISACIGQPPGDDAESARRMAVALDRIESEHDLLLLLADPAPTAWTRCCTRQGDEVVLLAHADDDPAPGAIERDCRLADGDGQPAPATVLVLLQQPGRLCPTGTARWRAPRRLSAHVHLREGDAAGVTRLARLLGRRGVGLVLSGGGARGAAHVGVYRALLERGVPVDAVAGTSMGAVFGALMAFGVSAEAVRETFARHFAANPTGDWTLMPLTAGAGGDGQLRDPRCAAAGPAGRRAAVRWRRAQQLPGGRDAQHLGYRLRRWCRPRAGYAPPAGYRGHAHALATAARPPAAAPAAPLPSAQPAQLPDERDRAARHGAPTRGCAAGRPRGAACHAAHRHAAVGQLRAGRAAGL